MVLSHFECPLARRFILVAITCGIPEKPAHGWVKFREGTGVGASAWYFCQQGFILVGSESRTCRADGKWVPDVPVCKRKYNIYLISIKLIMIIYIFFSW